MNRNSHARPRTRECDAGLRYRASSRRDVHLRVSAPCRLPSPQWGEVPAGAAAHTNPTTRPGTTSTATPRG